MLPTSIIRSLLTDGYYISPVPAGLMPDGDAGHHFATLPAKAAIHAGPALTGQPASTD